MKLRHTNMKYPTTVNLFILILIKTGQLTGIRMMAVIVTRWAVRHTNSTL